MEGAQQEPEAEQQALATCLERIEARLEWGASGQWTHSDFVRLSNQIKAETGLSVSHLTLKRVWGKVSYHGRQNNKTKQALARFAGFRNWQEVLEGKSPMDTADLSEAPPTETPPTTPLPEQASSAADQEQEPAEAEPAAPEPAGVAPKQPKAKLWLLLAGLVLLAGGLAWLFWPVGEAGGGLQASQPRFDTIRMRIKKITGKGPFTIQLGYKIEGENLPDTLQLEMDPEQKSLYLLTAEKQKIFQASRPGYQKIRLLHQGQLLKELPVSLKTRQWQVDVKQNYHSQALQGMSRQGKFRNSWLKVLPQDIKKENLQVDASEYQVNYTYTGIPQRFDADNFLLETRMKNSILEGGEQCGLSLLSLVCTKNFIEIPALAEGCGFHAHVYVSDIYLPGDKQDLSRFETSTADGIELRMENRNKHFKAFIDGRKVLDTTYNISCGQVMGFRYRFGGCGSVDYLRVRSLEGDTLFRDEFERPGQLESDYALEGPKAAQ